MIEIKPLWPLLALTLLLASCPKSAVGVFRQCSSDADCNDRGTCTTYGVIRYCDCNKFWGGDRCQQVCGKADIGLVLDASGSVEITNWNGAIVKFINDLAERLPVKPDGVHFGAVTYSLECDVSYTLNQGTTLKEVLSMTDAIDYSSYKSYTDTPCGLKLAATDIFKDSNGDRPTVNNFGLVITDGEANRFLGSLEDKGTLNATASELKQKAYVFGFGVNGAVESQIKTLSTDGDSYFVGVPFSEMQKYIQQIKGKVCEKGTPVVCPRDIVYVTPIPKIMSASDYQNINEFVTRTHSYYSLGPDATTVARIECTHKYTAIHDYIDDRKQLKSFYASHNTPQKTVAVPLAESCWKGLQTPLAGNRPSEDDLVIYVSNSESRYPDAEKQAKDALGLKGKQICIAIEYSNKQLKQMSELCKDDHMFVVDSTAELKKQGDYIDHVICGDTIPPCATYNCTSHGKCVNVLKGTNATAKCLCSTGYAGNNCNDAIKCKKDIFTLVSVDKAMPANHFTSINRFLSALADQRFYEANDQTAMARARCTHRLTTVHDLTAYSSPTDLQTNYDKLPLVKTVALPLAYLCWKSLPDLYATGRRPDADDVLLYITSQRSVDGGKELTAKTDFQTGSTSPGQTVFCIAVKASDEHVDQMAAVCNQDKVFVVDQASSLDNKMAEYINDVMCGDVQAPCSDSKVNCNGGKCVNLYPSKTHKCVCPPKKTGPNCNQSICSELDLAIILDRTTDIVASEWSKLTKALQAEIDRLPVSSGARVSLHVYDQDAGIQEFGLTRYTSAADMKSHVTGIKRNGKGHKMADQGLAAALTDFTANVRAGSQRHVVLVTNKYVWSTPDTVAEADKFRSVGATVHVLGAKAWVTSVLVDIAGGKADNVITISDYSDTRSALKWIMDGICGSHIKPTCSDGCSSCIAHAGSTGITGRCSCGAGLSGPTCKQEPPCLSSDLVYIIDSSQSNTPDSKYQNVRNFLVEVAKSLPVGGSYGVNMAAVLFGVPFPNGVKSLFSWKSDQSAIVNAFIKMPLMRWLTFTDVGIRYMLDNYKTGRPGNHDYALVLLDGYSSVPANTRKAVADARSAGYRFFVVGYNDVQKQELLEIADGDQDRVLMAYTHDSLSQLGQAVRLMLCGELQLVDNDPCNPNPCGTNGKCIRTMSSSGSWTYTCVCNPGFTGKNCDMKEFDCTQADLVIAVDSQLLTTADRQKQYDAFVSNYKLANPSIDVQTTTFTSPTNKDGISRIQSTLDQPSARNKAGTKAGRMGLLITAYDRLSADDKQALDDLYGSAPTNISIMTTGNPKELEPALEPRDRTYGIKEVDMDHFSQLHVLARAMLCRQDYTPPPLPKCMDKNICFLIDSSQSITPDNFRKEIQFVKNFIEASSTTSVFATVRYGFKPLLISKQSDHVTTHKMNLDGVKHERGLAIARRGFDLCFQDNDSGDKIMVIMADGKLNDPTPTVDELKSLHSQGVSTIPLSIGAEVGDVKDYVTGHFAQRGPVMTDWANLNNDKTLRDIIEQICTTV